MTDIWNLGQAGNLDGNSIEIPKTGKSDKTNDEAILFSGIMNNQMNSNVSSNSDVKTFDTMQSDTKIQKTNAAQSYDRYRYNKNELKSTDGMKDKISKSEKEISEFEKKIVNEVAEQMDVSPEDVENVMQAMGITAFELLQPQNLIDLVTNLTEVSNQLDLLSNPNFSQLMLDVQSMGQQLMSDLELTEIGFTQFLAQMSVPEESTSVEEVNLDFLNEEIPLAGLQTGDQFGMQATSEVQQTVLPEEQHRPVNEEIQVENDDDKESDNLVSIEVVDERENVQNTKSLLDSDSQSGSGLQKGESNTKPEQEPILTANQINNTPVQEMEMPQQVTYVDQTRTMDIIHQIAENVRVNLNADSTTLEMQLNPENLGKIYLEISQREGAIHARIAAANEAVKDALQLQMSTLQERMEQAGVKVDAVEVTVASHEFERNLEQGQNQERQNGERQEQQSFERRNLNLNHLDELSSVMSEEEALVAQMMKDNGNSVDFTA